MPTRRQVIIAGLAAGGLVLGGAGSAYVVTDRYEGWIREVLRRRLPGYGIDQDGLDLFVKDYYDHQGHAYKLRLFAAAEGVWDAKSVLPAGMAQAVAEEERRMLSDFLIDSNFFDDVNHPPTTVVYRGRTLACRSPFATF